MKTQTKKTSRNGSGPLAYFKTTEIRPQTLSRQLRKTEDPMLRRRRGAVALSLLASGAMGMVSLYQMGIIRHLPEPPLPFFDADKVDAADEAYQWMSSPDGILGLRSYATTAVLAASGGKDRVSRSPWLPIGLAAKVLVDSVAAGLLTKDQITRHKALCFWCLVAAGASFATLPLVIPEAREAVRKLAGR